MREVIIWSVSLLLAAGTELVLATRQGTSRSPRGLASDRIMQMLTVVSLVGPPLLSLITQEAPSTEAVLVGAFLTAGGLGLRVVAMCTLGHRFQLTPSTVSDSPQLVTTGVYRSVRHPGYTALLMLFTGLSLVSGGFIGAVFVAPLVPGIFFRIRVEEAILLSEFGDNYQSYREEVRWMLIPGLR